MGGMINGFGAMAAMMASALTQVSSDKFDFGGGINVGYGSLGYRMARAANYGNIVCDKELKQELHEFTVNGEKIMARSRKDALKRAKHKKR